MQRIRPLAPYRLHNIQATRALELAALASLAPNTLMQRAGLAVARLAAALLPHAGVIWLACGPGNNGGDGMEAAVHLLQRGYQPVVTWLGQPDQLPPDAHTAWQRAQQAGVEFATQAPQAPDLCIDALLGVGGTREPQGTMAQWIGQINASGAPVLAVDVPTGLNADTGACSPVWVRADHTLSLLTLKPGLFTAHGRDAAGQVWWDTLGVEGNQQSVNAVLAGPPLPSLFARSHASHKGNRGDVAVIGGARGMVGAAMLAASGALHAGAGRVFVSLLDDTTVTFHPDQPELMLRPFAELAMDTVTVVCGCGGGTMVAAVLPDLLQTASKLVLDADALNAIASDSTLQALLLHRAPGRPTVLTPHPLEAARLLGCSTAAVQADRILAAQQLAQRFQCVVMVKGSGTVTAAPGRTPAINPTGNGLLATGGTGDVLAGLVAARVASGVAAFDAAQMAAFQHGQLADDWPAGKPLTASALATALTG